MSNGVGFMLNSERFILNNMPSCPRTTEVTPSLPVGRAVLSGRLCPDPPLSWAGQGEKQ